MAFRTLTYRGQCFQATVDSETGLETYVIHNWTLRKFTSIRAVHREINQMLFNQPEF